MDALTSAHALYPQEVANIYSSSLLPLLLPGLEQRAEQSYSPLTATTTFRPLRNPTNLPLVPYTEAIPSMQGSAVSSYQGLQRLASAQPYSNLLSTVPDPATLVSILNAQQRFNNQVPMMLPSGTTAAPLTPFQNAQNSVHGAQPGSVLTPPMLNPNAPLPGYYMPNQLKDMRGSNLNTFGLQGKSLNTPGTLPTVGMFSGGANPGMSAVPGQSIIPTAQQLMSVVGVNQLLQYLNRINPTTFNSQTLLSAPRSLILKAINNLPYDTLLQIFMMLPVQQRASLIMLDLGIADYGEAMQIAEGYGAYLPPILSALGANQAKKRLAEVPTPLQVRPKVTI